MDYIAGMDYEEYRKRRKSEREDEARWESRRTAMNIVIALMLLVGYSKFG
ncbi:hypothetical protein JYT20_01300 [Rhodothermus sp. AH-315-K08]|nr:hypothetical protein [Rhodothermus sp. AH-315-K08]